MSNQNNKRESTDTREQSLEDKIQSQLVASGERERLKKLLAERLEACGWKDELKQRSLGMVFSHPKLMYIALPCKAFPSSSTGQDFRQHQIMSVSCDLQRPDLGHCESGDFSAQASSHVGGRVIFRHMFRTSV